MRAPYSDLTPTTTPTADCPHLPSGCRRCAVGVPPVCRRCDVVVTFVRLYVRYVWRQLRCSDQSFFPVGQALSLVRGVRSDTSARANGTTFSSGMPPGAGGIIGGSIGGTDQWDPSGQHHHLVGAGEEVGEGAADSGKRSLAASIRLDQGERSGGPGGQGRAGAAPSSSLHGLHGLHGSSLDGTSQSRSLHVRQPAAPHTTLHVALHVTLHVTLHATAVQVHVSHHHTNTTLVIVNEISLTYL